MDVEKTKEDMSSSDSTQSCGSPFVIGQDVEMKGNQNGTSYANLFPRISPSPAPNASFHRTNTDILVSGGGNAMESEEDNSSMSPVVTPQGHHSPSSSNGSSSTASPSPVIGQSNLPTTSIFDSDVLRPKPHHYIKANGFSGPKRNWVFKSGPYGLGYYRDVDWERIGKLVNVSAFLTDKRIDTLPTRICRWKKVLTKMTPDGPVEEFPCLVTMNVDSQSLSEKVYRKHRTIKNCILGKVYQMNELIRGADGVYHCHDLNKFVAVKSMEIQAIRTGRRWHKDKQCWVNVKEDGIKEIRAMLWMQDCYQKRPLFASHSYNVPWHTRLIDILRNDDYLFIVMEYHSQGDLYSFIMSKGTLAEGDSKQILRQLIEGVEYMHVCGIAHCDISPENTMLSSCGGYVKLIDWGACEALYDRSGNTTKLASWRGKVYYGAPESYLFTGLVKNPQAFDPAPADIWSLGVMAYVMTLGKPLFTIPYTTDGLFAFFSNNNVEICKKHLRNSNPSLSLALVDFVCRCCRINPLERLLMHDVVNHEWIRRR